MAVSGGIKFFKKSYFDIDAIVTTTTSTGTATEDFVRDRDNATYWQSVGSDDTTTETMEIDFGEAKTIDRIILVKNNFKNFKVEYWNDVTPTVLGARFGTGLFGLNTFGEVTSGIEDRWNQFTSVTTKETTPNPLVGAFGTAVFGTAVFDRDISEETNTKETNYYECESVSTQKIKLTVETTQVANAQKQLFQFIISQELGTFTGYPVYTQKHTRDMREKKTLRGKPRFTIFDDHYSSSLQFGTYPTAVDHALMLTLWDNMSDFLIYPCGADEDQYRFPMKGNRLEDLYLSFFDADFSPNYTQNVYDLGLNYSVGIKEVV